ncbi:MAG: diacylglycerol kinase family lipid kinase [bacterium]|nr:diacylglycerol kinase family lipid kinase [bacterium]
MATFAHIRFIVNPIAGTRRGDIQSMIRSVMAGVSFDICETEAAGHGESLAREAARAGVDLVVAVGGDGTLNEVGRGLLGTECALGVVPLGSGNALARAMGIPMGPEAACRVFLHPRVQTIDAGRMGESVFLANAGVGLDAEVVWRYNNRSGGRRGLWPYVVLTLSTLQTYRPEPIRVVLAEGTSFSCSPLLLAVANTDQYGNGATIAPGAVPDDGRLDLCVMDSPGVGRLVFHGWRLFTGTIDRMPGVRLFRTQGLRIERETSGRFQVDGEAKEGGAVLEVEVLPGAIRLVVPE